MGSGTCTAKREEKIITSRRERVNRFIDLAVEIHQESSGGYRDLGVFFSHLGKKVEQLGVLRIDSFLPKAIVDCKPGKYKTIKTAEYMDIASFQKEFIHYYQMAAIKGQKLFWADWIPSDSIRGKEVQDSQARFVATLFPSAIYIKGEIDEQTHRIKIRKENSLGEIVEFTTADALTAIPQQYLGDDYLRNSYICQAIIERNAFAQDSISPLAEIFNANLAHCFAANENEIEVNQPTRFGATGLGMGWLPGDFYVVTASLDNPVLLADAERSMAVGIEKLNQDVPDADPIIWFCSYTYNWEGPCGNTASEGEKKARELVALVSDFESLQYWYESSRVVPIPAIVESETSCLIPL